MVTVCAVAYVPATGLKPGVFAGGVMTKTAGAVTWLIAKPLAVAMACIVIDSETVIVPLYDVELLDGILPSVV